MHFCLDNNILTKVENTQFLGVLINCNLNSKDHISYIISQISKKLAIINKVKYKLPQSSLIMLHYALILPHLNYCNTVWGITNMTNLDRLLKVQKRAIRIITGSKFRAPTNPLCIKLHKLSQ